jgi:hypothetical protein
LREGHGKRSKGKINVCRPDRFRDAGVNPRRSCARLRIAASGSCRAALDLGTAGDTDAAGSLTTSDAVTDEKTLDARVEALVRCANRLI